MKKEFKESETDSGRLDSSIGITLVCGAIIRSEKGLGKASIEEVTEIINSLTSCFSKPSVSPVAYNFLAELVTKVCIFIFSSYIYVLLTSYFLDKFRPNEVCIVAKSFKTLKHKQG